MKLGAFSTSLSVKDLATSREFYENLGFNVFAGSMEQNYLIMKNGNALIGLFQGMFEGNILTFNPGWDESANAIDPFDDVREIQKHLKGKGTKLVSEADEATSGPASFMFADPDGNMILIDQHRSSYFMIYQTFPPHPDLAALVKCLWILEVPADPSTQKQRIVPDGCIEMFFILGDDVERYTSENETIIQPRAMVLGQITEPLFIRPTGEVKTFAVRFYPYGFSNFVKTPISTLANKETPITDLFGEASATSLTQNIVKALNTEERIAIIQKFLLDQLKDQTTIDSIVQSTVDSLFQTRGSVPINSLLKDEPSKRRTLERKFSSQVGLSPKQLSKIVRIQTALKMLLEDESESLTKIAYESDYYDQAHFTKDFKEFTGINPRDFLTDQQMTLSSIFYTED